MFVDTDPKYVECFSGFELDYCFALFDLNGLYGVIGIEIKGDGGAIHLNISRFSHNTVKVALKDWVKLLAFFREKDCKWLVATNADTDDSRWPKLIKKFGFPEPATVWVSKVEI